MGLEQLRVDKAEPRIAGIALSVADRKALGEDVDDWGDLVEIPRSLRGVEVAYLLREQSDGTVRASLRSNPPYEVGPVAQHFGGGGHLQAAGCTIEGEFKAVQRALLKRLRAVL